MAFCVEQEILSIALFLLYNYALINLLMTHLLVNTIAVYVNPNS